MILTAAAILGLALAAAGLRAIARDALRYLRRTTTRQEPTMDTPTCPHTPEWECAHSARLLRGAAGRLREKHAEVYDDAGLHTADGILRAAAYLEDCAERIALGAPQPEPTDLCESDADAVRRFARRLAAVERLVGGRPGYHTVTVKALLTAMSDADA